MLSFFYVLYICATQARSSTTSYLIILLLFEYIQCLTRDSVTVTVDAVVFFKIKNATVSITNVQNVQASTKLLAQTTLRNMIGTRILSDILTKREDLSAQMQVGFAVNVLINSLSMFL